MAHRLKTSLSLIFLSLAGCTATGCAPPPTYHDGDHLPVTVAGHTFDAELKLTPESRFRGMGGRTDIPADFAMLFAYPQPHHLNYVMRDCAFPLDILFLDGEGRVVAKHHMPIEPPGTPEEKLIRYDSDYSAQFVLEVKGGWLEKLKVTVGETRLDIPKGALAAAKE